MVLDKLPSRKEKGQDREIRRIVIKGKEIIKGRTITIIRINIPTTETTEIKGGDLIN